MIPLGILFIFLALIAIAPPVLVILGHYPGHFFKRVELFVSEYDGVLISLGTLILVSFLALLTTFLANKYADRREASNRKIQSELKVSEYRQAWINDLRDTIAEFGAKTSDDENGHEHKESIVGLVFKIEMLMNPKDCDYEKLRAALKYRADAQSPDGTTKLNPDHDNLLGVSQGILKREWDRLNKDLAKVEKATRSGVGSDS